MSTDDAPPAGAPEAGEVAALPVPCLVVLVGPSGSGKSTWARLHFDADEIVSADRLRAVVGHGEDDLDASADAFALLDTIVEHRVRRGLTTVVDTLGLDGDRRAALRAVAARHDRPCVAVAFDVPAAACRARNASRPRPVPADVLKRQLATWTTVREGLAAEGWTQVLAPASVRRVPARLRVAATAADAQRADPVRLRFGLQVSAFDWPDGDGPSGAAIPEALRAVATAAERVGFDSLWVMDHVRQIPQVGRDWDPMLECWTTLAWLAGGTSRIRLGSLVSPVTLRNVAHLGKIVATLDVLSGGRAIAGLGLGWYEREHRGYGWPFPPTSARYELLEDALRALPQLWGPGAKPFEGTAISIPETICYPRPRQARIPIIVGGGGERRTLRLAAAHADGINVMGDPAMLAHKVQVLRAHAAAVGRDPTELEVTHFGPVLVAEDAAALRSTVDRLRPRGVAPDRWAASVGAGTVEDHVGRARALADAGADTVIVSLADLTSGGVDEAVAAVETCGRVVAAFAAEVPHVTPQVGG